MKGNLFPLLALLLVWLFPQAGKVDFWTKAGAVTLFDDFRVEVLP